MPRTSPPRKDKNRVPRVKRELAPAAPKEAERIAKVVARAGLGSRREIEEWIEAGRVAVNGEVLTSPAVTVTAADAITVDGAPLPERERTRLFIYHKPKGVVTTNRDPEGRTTLFEILPQGLPRLVSVGRLDLNSEGLLLLTNDGGLARVLELPETGWLRRYRVRANGEVNQAQLDSLLKGITVDGVEYGPIEAELDRVQGANAWITVSLREGKNREIRNVFGALGLQVNRLIRVSYGPFQLGDVPEGGIEEVRTRVLRDQIGADLAAAAGADFTGLLVEREVEEAPLRVALRPAGKRQAAAETGGTLKAPARRSSRQDEDFDAPVEDVIRPAGPRTRRRMSDENAVESRGSVADRKGRTVKVERVVAPKSDAPERGGRTGARPGARRGDRDEAGARPFRRGPAEGKERFSERGPARPGFRDDARGPRRERDDREDFRRRPTREGEDRPRRPRPETAEGAPRRSRDERPQQGERPFRARSERPEGRGGEQEGRPARSGSRPYGDKPAGRARPAGDRPAGAGRSYGERSSEGAGRSYGDKPAGRARPSGDRPAGGAGRSYSERASESTGRSYGDKPAGRARPSGDRPASGAGRSYSERASESTGRSYGDKPAGRARPTGDRPAGGAGRSYGERSSEGAGRSYGDKPAGRARPSGDRPAGGAGRAYGDKPAGRSPSFGDKPAGGRSGGFGGTPGGKPGAGRGGFGGKPGGKPAGRAGGGKAGGGKPSGPRGKR
ncbi:pseudouridine synthase [Xanthobacter autotrophicus]|uniref:pseudouridine synthase n=1 Tax=Xanthobacter autotrophicus TaxID=280 RepID=UPI0024A6B591|nr:pseudouridine synthase [Xanthobacter autotrophicus]MDI4658694.1 pseudouridine synthase [Xanthobacter autotrophicus]